MRAIFTAVLIVITSSVALAGENFGETVLAIPKHYAVAKAGEELENRLNRRERVQPVQAGQSLGRIIISRGDGHGWYDEDLLVRWAGEALREVGFTVISRDGRNLVMREMEESCAPEFNPATTLEGGTLNGAELFAVISVREGSGPDRSYRVSERSVRVEVDTESEWAAVNLQVVNAAGIIIAATDQEAVDSATSVDISTGWCRGAGYQGWQPTRRDRAVVAATTKAANVVGRQLAARRAGQRFDPATGKPLGALPCPLCGVAAGPGANFCSQCGAKLDAPDAGGAPGPSNAPAQSGQAPLREAGELEGLPTAD